MIYATILHKDLQEAAGDYECLAKGRALLCLCLVGQKAFFRKFASFSGDYPTFLDTLLKKVLV